MKQERLNLYRIDMKYMCWSVYGKKVRTLKIKIEDERKDFLTSGKM